MPDEAYNYDELLGVNVIGTLIENALTSSVPEHYESVEHTHMVDMQEEIDVLETRMTNMEQTFRRNLCEAEAYVTFAQIILMCTVFLLLQKVCCKRKKVENVVVHADSKV